jgi:hypothetical protein
VTKKRGKVPWKTMATVALLFAAVLGGGLYWRLHPSAKLAERDMIVLADFSNTTGDAIFDDTLKQALATHLAQSPYLNVLSDQSASVTLRMMGRSPSDRITLDTAREICQRTGSKAVLAVKTPMRESRREMTWSLPLYTLAVRRRRPLAR